MSPLEGRSARDLGRRAFLRGTGGALAGLAALTEGCYPALNPGTPRDPGWKPGIEQRLASSCLVCPARCGVTGRVVDGRLVAIAGNPMHPMSRGGLCGRGAAAVQTLYHPERLTTPLMRTGPRGAGGWRPLTAHGAATLLSERLGALRTSGHPERLAVLAGYCAGSMDALWRQLLHAFGSPNYVADAYADGTDAVMNAMHGIAQAPSYDLDRASLVVSFGAPLFEAWWSPVQAHGAFGRGSAQGRRPRVVQVDTRFSRTAARAHEWLGIRPRTHAVLALGIAYVLIREQLVDAEFLARRVAGFDDWKDERGALQPGYRSLVLRRYRTEEVSAATGVPVERIVALAKQFADRAPAVAIVGSDVTLAPDGVAAGMAVHSLNVITGAIGRPGGVLFRDEPPLAPLPRVVVDGVARRGLAAGPAVVAPPFGAAAPARLAERIASGEAPVEALLLYYANPLASADRTAWAAALAKASFVVSFSPFMDETARQADVIIPDLLPQERWQDAPAPPSYPYPAWGITQPLVQGPAECRGTGDVLLTLAAQLGGGVAASLPYADMPTLLKARAGGLFAARRGMPFDDEFETRHQAQMEDRGWWLAAAGDADTFWTTLVERGGWFDPFYDHTDPARIARNPDGKIALLPATLRHRAGGATPVPLYQVAADAHAPDAFPLRLLPFRLSTLSSGGMALAAWLAERPATFPDVHWLPWVEVHPATARGFGLGDGDMVKVISPKGSYRAQVKHFTGAARDAVNAPYGLRHPDGSLANPLALLDGAADPLTDLPSWCTTFVRLERA